MATTATHPGQSTLPGSPEALVLRTFLEAEAPAMQDVLHRFRKVSPMSVPVLITGESGTGKEVVARAIHASSTRRDQPFVAVNCAALPRDLLEAELFGYAPGAFTGAAGTRMGKFEAAMAGTLLLDEVGDMPLDLQAKLLRAVQERVFEPLGTNRQVPFQARILSATSRNLRTSISSSNFRLDLYYRLAVVTLELPPLRRRLEDLPRISQSLLHRHCHREDTPPIALAPEVHDVLKRHDWPGNIRELENVLISSAIAAEGSVIRDVVLPAVPMRQPALDKHKGMLLPLPVTEEQIAPLAEYEQMIIEAALQATDGNLSECARRLGVGRATLRRKIAKGL